VATAEPAPRCRPTASISSTKTMRGRVGLGLLEQVAHAGGADADEHLDEVGAGDRVERHAASPATARASSVLPVPGGP
jgi:hypothetical protein